MEAAPPPMDNEVGKTLVLLRHGRAVGGARTWSPINEKRYLVLHLGQPYPASMVTDTIAPGASHRRPELGGRSESLKPR
ncbi:hypothetical protein EDF39_2493 [Frondihabitans sp. PhB161]|nr:hypothetical protein EDF37_3369 [Frondihabitans sp. PhB153]RPF04074.1 hypothetical protein EDF39_2493 [Frondihabitans sp. PhB161]